MKHTDHKTLSLAAVALSALVLAGCADNGGGGGGAGTTAEATPETTAEATPTDEESPSPSGTATDDESPSPSGTASPTGTAGTGAAGGAATAVVGALAAAQEAVPEGEVFELDRKDDDEGWEVKLAVGDREQEVDVTEDGSDAVAQEGDDELDQEDRERLAEVQVPLEEAVSAALDEVDGELDGAQLDSEDGITVWEVDVDTPDGSSVDVYVNVENGSVVKVDR